MPGSVQRQIIDKDVRLYVLDAIKVAEAAGLGKRINTVMQVAFFALSGVLPKDDAVRRIKTAIEKTYMRKGEALVRQNFAAVDGALNLILTREDAR